MPPVIALVTDFGLQDAYVGAMKGAILCIAPVACYADALGGPGSVVRVRARR